MVGNIRSLATAYDSTWRSPPRRLIGLVLGIGFAMLITLILCATVLAADAPVAARTSALFVQGGLAATVGSLVDVPIGFDSGGAHVAALSFSLDYDSECLALSPDDQNHDGLPDAFMLDAPTQFIPSIDMNPGNQQGRVDVILADYIPPLAALRDSAALFTIQFRIICPLAPGLVFDAHVDFATTPVAGFSDPSGYDLPGVARGGAVQVIGAIPGATPTPIETTTPPAGSPTPTATATAPVPNSVVLIEVMALPEQLTYADRSVIFVLDYVVLEAESDVMLSIPVPQHTYFDATASTLGWQCDSDIVNRKCQFALYETTRQSSMNGRLFFAVGLNWPLPAKVTQIEFVGTIETKGEPSSQIQSLVLPLHSVDVIPQIGDLALDLNTVTPELVAGRDHELPYTFTYTNSGQTVLHAVEFYLILPVSATVRRPSEEIFAWECASTASNQVVCTVMLNEIQPGAQGQAPFMLVLEASSLRNMSAIALVVYAVHEGIVLSSDASGVPIRQFWEPDVGGTKYFLPFIGDSYAR